MVLLLYKDGFDASIKPGGRSHPIPLHDKHGCGRSLQEYTSLLCVFFTCSASAGSHELQGWRLSFTGASCSLVTTRMLIPKFGSLILPPEHVLLLPVVLQAVSFRSPTSNSTLASQMKMGPKM